MHPFDTINADSVKRFTDATETLTSHGLFTSSNALQYNEKYNTTRIV